MGFLGIMSYDEAMEKLIDGTASPSVLEKAYKRVRKNDYNADLDKSVLHLCFGRFYGFEETCGHAETDAFGSVWLSANDHGTLDEENLETVKRFLEKHPDFSRTAFETALNMQPDDKNLKYATAYLIFAYLYGAGAGRDIENAEEYANKAIALGDEKADVWKDRIESIKSGR